MVFIYEAAGREAVKGDLEKARKACMAQAGATEQSVRSDVRTLMNHRLLLVPSDPHAHGPSVDRLKTIARLAGLAVEPMAVWYARTQHPIAAMQRNHSSHSPAAAVAAPPTQQRAVAGEPHPTHR